MAAEEQHKATQRAPAGPCWKSVPFEVGGIAQKKKNKCFIVLSLVRPLVNGVEAEKECSESWK